MFCNVCNDTEFMIHSREYPFLINFGKIKSKTIFARILPILGKLTLCIATKVRLQSQNVH